ncbi:MAG: glycosyltransferase family 39 protein [Gemmatimonadota bacterium]
MANPDPSATRTQRWLRLAPGTLIVLGALLRLRAYFHFRPLWLDEAMLSLNIGSRSFVQLLKPLTDDQSAPIPFLWATRLSITVGGMNEASLRLLPLVCGVLLLVLLWRTARNLLDTLPALVALAMAVLSPLLIYYSNEVKPYVVDALVTLIVVNAVLVVIADSESPKPWRRLGLTGVFAVLASAPAFLVLAGAGAALLFTPGIWAGRESRRRLLFTGTAWACTFGVVYVAFIRPAASNPYLQTYWASSFLSPLEPHLASRAASAFGTTMQGIFVGDGGSWRATVGLALLLGCAAGAVRLARTRGVPILMLLVVPPLAAVAASMVHRYPIAPRLMLFASPLTILLLAAGLDGFTARLERGARTVALLVVSGAILLLPLRGAIHGFIAPSEQEDVRSLTKMFAREHRRGEAIYVFSRSVPSWAFYSTDWSAPDLLRIGRLTELVGSSGPAFRNAPTRGRAVANEGDSLQFREADFQELIGIPAGTGPTLEEPGGAERPDTGWADNERRRIRIAAGLEPAWVLVSSFKPAVGTELLRSLKEGGATILSRSESASGFLLKVKF